MRADDATRTSYLRKVAGLTLAGLTISAFTGTLSAGVIAMAPGLFANQIVSLVIILGAYGYANWIAQKMVFSDSSATRTLGFVTGTVAQGVAMGYLLLQAVVMGSVALGNPFAFIAQAMGLVALSAGGMLLYLMTGPKELSYVKGALSIMFMPMLALMAISFVFPIGGPMGLLISFVFVGVSAAGLLYQMNFVMHNLRTDQHVGGAYTVTMGLLILFWNLLTLLMRMNRR